VLDPACGTAGFLISYKHIVRQNTDPQGNSTLTPDDRGRLAQNFRGYDISPDMVRLSLMNLYLWHTLNIYRREGRYIQFMRMNVNGLFNREELRMVEIALPALPTQQAIVAEIEAEQALVAANRELIARFEQKIQATLARVWGEATPDAPETTPTRLEHACGVTTV